MQRYSTVAAAQNHRTPGLNWPFWRQLLQSTSRRRIFRSPVGRNRKQRNDNWDCPGGRWIHQNLSDIKNIQELAGK